MKASLLILSAVVPCLMAGAAKAQSHALVTERTLSLDAAREAATAALEQCRKNGHSVTVTVLNRSGRTKVVLHDEGAGPHTIENSFRKAYTTISFRGVPSGDFGRNQAKNPPPHPALFLSNVTSAEGALPIKAGNEVVGSIGVSGAPGGDKDAVCAQAGIDRIAKSLN
jgi:uncharacterized protein GlcG (DUF336 family)